MGKEEAEDGKMDAALGKEKEKVSNKDVTVEDISNDDDYEKAAAVTTNPITLQPTSILKLTERQESDDDIDSSGRGEPSSTMEEEEEEVVEESPTPSSSTTKNDDTLLEKKRAPLATEGTLVTGTEKGHDLDGSNHNNPVHDSSKLFSEIDPAEEKMKSDEIGLGKLLDQNPNKKDMSNGVVVEGEKDLNETEGRRTSSKCAVIAPQLRRQNRPQYSTQSMPGATRVGGRANNGEISESEDIGTSTEFTATSPSSPAATANTITLQATAVDDTDLEQQIRQQIEEEYVKAEIHETFWTKERVIGVFVFALAVVVAAIAGGVVASRNNNNDPPPPTADTAQGPTDMPSTNPTDTPTASPTLSDESEDILQVLKDESPDGGMALDDPYSPQYQAFLWLISGDTPPDKTRLVQRHSLATLYYSTGGEKWSEQEGWLTDADECTWSGIGCDLSFLVRDLTLNSNNLDGILPPELCKLSEFAVIELQENNLFGSIPSGFNFLSSLASLNLEQNMFTGSAPISDRFEVMTELYLGSNDFNGTIPTGIGGMISLETLDMSKNERLSGPMPTELAQLTNLEELILSEVSLSGTLPSSVLASLTRLKTMNLNYCGLGGPLSSSIGNLIRLEVMDIGYNSFSGSIPEMNQMTSLVELYFHSNSFNGTFPQSLTALDSLQVIDVRGNGLTSSIPPSLTNLTSLKKFSVQSNKMSGSIPTTIGLMTGLQEFKTSSNEMTGVLPTELALLTNLKKLFVNTNKHTGTIPSELGGMPLLSSLVIHTNDLVGTIPTELANLDMSMLQLMFLEGIVGTFPTEFGRLTGMSRIRITETSLTGPLPSELGHLTLVRNFKVQNNLFSGELPSELGNMASLSEFSVFNNTLSGTIPSSLLNLNFLTAASFALNSFTGFMPFCDESTDLETLVGDCAEVTCPCCTTCCVDGEECDAPDVAGRSSSSYLLNGPPTPFRPGGGPPGGGPPGGGPPP